MLIRHRRHEALHVGLLLLGLLLVARRNGSTLLAWMATGCIILAATQLAPLVRDGWYRLPQTGRFGRERIEHLGPYLIAVVMVMVSLGAVSLGEMPVSQDHAQHLLATSVFVDDMVAHGHLFGWSERIGSGLPFGDVYGTAVYLVTGLLSIITLGLVPIDVSYAFGMILVWGVPALALVAWVRRLGGGVGACLIATLALVTDPGGNREGGWGYSMFIAVWPQHFATGLFFLALLRLHALSERPTWRRLGGAVLLTGYAVWAHPMNALNFALACPLLLGVLLMTRRQGDADQPQRLVWLLVALVVSVLIAGGWIAHMAGASSEVNGYSAHWESLEEIARGMLTGSPFINHPVLLCLPALLGVFATAVSRRPFHIFSLALFIALLVVGSMDLLIDLDLGLHKYSPLVMYRRFSMTVKPLWYAYVGCGVLLLQVGWSHLRERWQTSPLSPRRAAVVAFIVAPLIWSLWVSLPWLVVSPSSRPLTARRAGVADELVELQRQLEAERASHRGGPLRVAQWRQPGQIGEYELIPIALAGYGYLPTSTPPCQTFSNFNAGRHLETMRWLGASLFISRSPAALADSIRVGTYGPYHLYRVKGAADHPVRLNGAGEVEVVHWSPMRQTLKLSGVDSGSKLVLGFPPYHKWHARQGDRELTIETESAGHGYKFVRIGGLEDGELDIAYRDTWLEIALFTLAVLLTCLALWALFRVDAPLPSLLRPARSEQLLRAVRWGLATLVVLLFLATPILGRQAQRAAWESPDGGPLLRVLHQHPPLGFTYEPASYCIRPFTADPRGGCHELDLEPVLRAATHVRGHSIPSCMRFGVPDAGKAELRFALPEGTVQVALRIHVESGNPAAWLVMDGSEHPLPGGGRMYHHEVTDASDLVLRFRDRGRATSHLCLELAAMGASPEQERAAGSAVQQGDAAGSKGLSR